MKVSTFFLSILLHVLLVLVAFVYFKFSPESDCSAVLDISSVELVLSEPPSPPAPPSPSQPQPPSQPYPQPQPHPHPQPQPPPTPPPQARIDAPPRLQQNLRPDYPKGARQRGEQGDVTLEVRVNAEGAVTEVKVVVGSGFAELDRAAVQAVEKAKFHPARSGENSVDSTARLTLRFRLR